MPHPQIQRLQNDSAQLESFAQKLEIEGKYDLVKKIKAKKEFLDEYITSKSKMPRVKAA